jgi:hypothetical protein
VSDERIHVHVADVTALSEAEVHLSNGVTLPKPSYAVLGGRLRRQSNSMRPTWLSFPPCICWNRCPREK